MSNQYQATRHDSGPWPSYEQCVDEHGVAQQALVVEERVAQQTKAPHETILFNRKFVTAVKEGLKVWVCAGISGPALLSERQGLGKCWVF